ncbi:MAG: radical SAM protein [Clostridiaceae bacterium]|nr:radical SAM protein [Clostridiaceae bacterium]
MVDNKLNETAVCNFKMADLIFGRYLYLVIYVTENCNFCCEYCFQQHQPKSLSQKTAESIVKFVKRELFKYQGVKISWFGGEPLLEMDIIEEISLQIKLACRQSKKVFWAEVTTNGYLLTPENMSRLIVCNVVDYTITLDGLKENHDKYRHTLDGQPSNDIIMGNLISIRDLVHHSSVSILIRTNVTKESIMGLKKFYLTLDTLFGSDKRFSLLIKPVYDWGGTRIENIKSVLLKDFGLDILYKIVSEFNLQLKFWGNINELEFGGKVCHACYANRWTIGIDGQVSKCDTCSPVLSVGWLADGMLITDMATLEWSNQIFDIEGKCISCPLRGVCLGGTCPQKRIIYGTRVCFLENGINALLSLVVNTISEEENICTISVM